MADNKVQKVTLRREPYSERKPGLLKWLNERLTLGYTAEFEPPLEVVPGREEVCGKLGSADKTYALMGTFVELLRATEPNVFDRLELNIKSSFWEGADQIDLGMDNMETLVRLYAGSNPETEVLVFGSRGFQRYNAEK